MILFMGNSDIRVFYVHRIYAITKYWFKILQSDDRKYIKIIYNLMLRDIETKPNIKNWASLLRNILSNLGFLHVWLSQGVGDIKQFLVVLKQRLTDNFLQQWQSRLNDSSRAVFLIYLFKFLFSALSRHSFNKTNKSCHDQIEGIFPQIKHRGRKVE